MNDVSRSKDDDEVQTGTLKECIASSLKDNKPVQERPDEHERRIEECNTIVFFTYQE